MKPHRLLFAAILLACCLLPSCATTSTTDPAGQVTKTTVPDKDFTASLATLAGVAAKEAAAAYIATHQPQSAAPAQP